MAAGNPEMAALFLMLTFLASGSPDGQQEAFDFEAILKENNVEMQVDPLMAVLTGPDARKVRPIIEQLGDADYDRREEATKRLETMGPAVLPLLKKYGLKSADLEIRVRARKLVSKILEGDVNYVPLHRAALAALGKLKAEKAVKLLEEYLDNDDSRLRRAAAFALAEIGSREARRSLSRKIRDAAKQEGPAFLDVLEVLDGFAVGAKEKDLDEIEILAGKGSRVVDLRVIELLAGSGSLRTWADTVCTYIAAWDKEGSVPPQFIREFLTAAYGLKPDEKFDWVGFCKKRSGRIRKISGKNLEELRKRFLAGLEQEKLLAEYEECFRFVPSGTINIAGVDMRQMRQATLAKDFDEYVRKDKALATAVRKLVEGAGPFRTDIVVGCFTLNIAEGQGHVSIVGRGRYDSAKQTRLYSKLLGWKKVNYEGIEYIKSEDEYIDVSFCFYDDKYVVMCIGIEQLSPMESVLDSLRGSRASILADRGITKMLDRQTLTSAIWHAGVLEKLLGAAVTSAEPLDEEERSILTTLMQLREYVVRATPEKTGIGIEVRGECKTAKAATELKALVERGLKEGKRELDEEIEDAAESEYMGEDEIETMKVFRNFLDTVKVSADGAGISGEGSLEMEKIYKMAKEQGFPELTKVVIEIMEDELPRVYILEKKIEWAKERNAGYKKRFEETQRSMEELSNEMEDLNKQPDSPEKADRLEEIQDILESLHDSIEWRREVMEETAEKLKKLEEELREAKANPSSPGKPPQEEPEPEVPRTDEPPPE
ncbi:MAG: HEAT repeat domain-containing protein [Planctomycetota bacterium]